MKKALFAIFVITITAFTNMPGPDFDISSFKKNFAKVKTGLYVCKYELSNLEYRSFLTDMANAKDMIAYQTCLPDSISWKEQNNTNAPYVDYYFRNTNFDNYPVVGVSYEAANKYCNWLTNQYNQDKKRRFKTVLFRLLSKEEWIYAANKGDTAKVYTWGSGFIQNNRKQYLCNFKITQFLYDSATRKYHEYIDSSIIALNTRNTIAGPVKAFYPSSTGMYNMCGNVAEMIEEKGIAKGGSYNDPAYKVTIASESHYTKPQADIGFRVAMQVIEE